MFEKLTKTTGSGRVVTDEPIPAHSLLQGKTELGRGESCIVLDKGDDERVYKIVTCPATYAFLASPERPAGDHYPRLFTDHGKIGETRQGFPIYLLEMEKLYPLDATTEAYVQAEKIRLAYLEGCHRWASWAGGMGAMALLSMTRTPMGFSSDILEALQKLSVFVEEFQALPDLLNKNNLMMRKDGTLVFADPIFLG